MKKISNENLVSLVEQVIEMETNGSIGDFLKDEIAKNGENKAIKMILMEAVFRWKPTEKTKIVNQLKAFSKFMNVSSVLFCCNCNSILWAL